MPLFLNIPPSISCSVEAHNAWLDLVDRAEELVDEDIKLQKAAAKTLRLKQRNLPPELIGKTYASYCDLLNKMYDAYLNSVHLQRATYMLEIIGVIMKRMYELRNELVHIIVNDYVYVDRALSQLRMTPHDIQIIVPYHIAAEARPDSMELMLQKMWTDAVKRKNKRPPKFKTKPKPQSAHSAPVLLDDDGFPQTVKEPSAHEEEIEEEEEEVIPVASVHTIIPEEFIQMCVIQRMERFRQYFMIAFYKACTRRRTYFKAKVEEAPLEIKNRAAKIVQRVYREYMRLKRKKVLDLRRDIFLGIAPDPYRKRLDFTEENNKVYERRRRARQKIRIPFERETTRENDRLIFCRKDGQIEDITDQIHEWFREWYYGYGFFPEYPYEVDGGTVLVMTGQYDTIEERMEADEKYIKATKGKTKEQLKQEKENAKRDADLKAQALKDKEKGEAEKLFKSRCDPFGDPGYQIHTSQVTDEVVDVLRRYRNAWSIYDTCPPEKFAEIVYGYLKPVIIDEIMHKMHKECRVYVDELMRLELKLLIKAQQLMWKRVEWKWPKFRPRPRPRVVPVPKPFIIDDALYKTFDSVFDLNLVSKPTSKLNDIFGDFNYAAYDMNIQDPDATYPPPAYGDIKRRLVLSCVFGTGVEPGAKRNKSVMLVGPPQNGKSFLVDCVAGELNAVKIDISPEVLSAKVKGMGRILGRVFNAAKVFQPTVIYCRNIEKVFCKKVLPEDKPLKAKSMKTPLTKLLKAMSSEDKVIFIATCSYPMTAKAKPMCNIFSELLLVPRTDYGSIRMFFYEKFQKIRSLPREYCMEVQPLAQLLQGYGFGNIIRLYNEIMTDERIIRLNITPLAAAEFLYPLINQDIYPVSREEYQVYIDFCLNNGPLKAERIEYNIINMVRKEVYKKAAERQAKKEAQAKA